MGFPLSSDSRLARYNRSLSIKSASLLRSWPRAEASIVRQALPKENAFLAAVTANSTSALSPSCTEQMVSPVAGFTVWKVFPEAEFTHSLFMKIWVYFMSGFLRGSIFLAFLKLVYNQWYLLKGGPVKGRRGCLHFGSWVQPNYTIYRTKPVVFAERGAR